MAEGAAGPEPARPARPGPELPHRCPGRRGAGDRECRDGSPPYEVHERDREGTGPAVPAGPHDHLRRQTPETRSRLREGPHGPDEGTPGHHVRSPPGLSVSSHPAAESLLSASAGPQAGSLPSLNSFPVPDP